MKTLDFIYIGICDKEIKYIRSHKFIIANVFSCALPCFHKDIPNSAAYLILQRHNRVIFGCIDMQNMVFVLRTEIIGNVCEGCAGSLGYSVVNNHHIIFFIQCHILSGTISCMTLLYFSDFVPCNSPFC